MPLSPHTSPASPSGDRTRRVGVASDQSLVAEAVRINLAGRGLDTRVIPWPHQLVGELSGAGLDHVDRTDDEAAAAEVDAVLLLCELECSRQVRQAQHVASRSRGRVVLLTGAPPGPLWGALIAYGVDVVLPLSTSMEELEPVLVDPPNGKPLMRDDVRDQVLRDWFVVTERQQTLADRVEVLSPRERTILVLLHRGETVRGIVEELGIQPATVRTHIRGVLRKLGVNSQLAAVALYQAVLDTRDPELARTP